MGVPGYGPGNGPVQFGDQLNGDFGFGLLPSLQTDPENIPNVDFQSELCVDFQIATYADLWTAFYTGFLIMFYADFYSDYGPAVFLSPRCPANLGHFAGLWQSPQLSSGQSIGLPHTLTEESIPLRFHKCLRPQQRMSTFTAYLEVKRGSPGLPFSFLLLHKWGTLVLCLGDAHCGTHPSVLFRMCDTLSDARWIDLLLNWVLLRCLGGPGGTYVLPLSALMMPCARTSHVR